MASLIARRLMPVNTGLRPARETQVAHDSSGNRNGASSIRSATGGTLPPIRLTGGTNRGTDPPTHRIDPGLPVPSNGQPIRWRDSSERTFCTAAMEVCDHGPQPGSHPPLLTTRIDSTLLRSTGPTAPGSSKTAEPLRGSWADWSAQYPPDGWYRSQYRAWMVQLVPDSG